MLSSSGGHGVARIHQAPRNVCCYMAHATPQEAMQRPTAATPQADVAVVPQTRAAARGAMRRRILALLQGHPEGLSPAELRRRLEVDRDLNNTCFAMARDGLL